MAAPAPERGDGITDGTLRAGAEGRAQEDPRGVVVGGLATAGERDAPVAAGEHGFGRRDEGEPGTGDERAGDEAAERRAGHAELPVGSGDQRFRLLTTVSRRRTRLEELPAASRTVRVRR